MIALSARHSAAAVVTTVFNTDSRSKAERLMTFNTSLVAVCCSSASRNSASRCFEIGDVEIGQHAAAIGQRDALVAQDASVGAAHLARRDVAGADRRDPALDKRVKLRLGHVVEAVVAVVVDQFAPSSGRWRETRPGCPTTRERRG